MRRAFDATPSVSVANSGSSVHAPFTGGSTTVLHGTTAQTITVEVGSECGPAPSPT